MKSFPIAFNQVAAHSLLLVWLGVVGLEVHHQWGHVVAGCSHHHHHGSPIHEHEHCLDWQGPHKGTQWDHHEHLCTLCEWEFLPLAKPLLLDAEEIASVNWFLRNFGQPNLGFSNWIGNNVNGKRGPPFCG